MISQPQRQMLKPHTDQVTTASIARRHSSLLEKLALRLPVAHGRHHLDRGVFGQQSDRGHQPSPRVRRKVGNVGHHILEPLTTGRLDFRDIPGATIRVVSLRLWQLVPVGYTTYSAQGQPSVNCEGMEKSKPSRLLACFPLGQ